MVEAKKKSGLIGNMQKVRYYILAMLMVLVGCTRDNEPVAHDVDFCVRAVWENGLGESRVTRTATSTMATDLLADGSGPIAIDYSDYPEMIDMYCSDGTVFSLTKETSACTTHGGYFIYTPSVIYKDLKIKNYDLTFQASAVIDEEAATGGDRLVGEADKNKIVDTHMQLTLHHTKALVRFAFRVDPRYDKVRYIVVKNIELNDKDCVVGNKVLRVNDYQAVAYIYIDPSSMRVDQDNNTIVCTYDIYDKDAKFDGSMDDATLAMHLDRGGVKASNTFTFEKLKDAEGNKVNNLDAGYYYDLRVTLNPDYLYVLSDHDNKQLTIN